MPLKEKLLLQRIRRAAARRGGVLQAGIGDDCAILRLPRGHEALLTTDFSLEGVHFRRDWHPPDAVGHRCLTRGLSDIAAMGGVPQAAFLSLALPPDLPQKWVDDFISGLLWLADRYSVRLAGGDTAQSPAGVLTDIVVLGSVPAGKAILRSGAKPGDLIYVTGSLGSALTDLTRLRDGEKLRPKAHLKHFYPEPRIAVGQFLREKKLASAMIDISDGLSTDLAHICEESKVGAVIYGADIPLTWVPRSSRKLAGAGQALTAALHGGDEYELLFTARPDRKIPRQIAGVPITRIGEVLRGDERLLATPDGRTAILKPQGWEHFA